MKRVLIFFSCWMMTVSLMGRETSALPIETAPVRDTYLSPCECRSVYFCPPVHYLQIGFNCSYVCFKQDGAPEFDGNLGGVQLLYEYKPLNCFYAGLEVAWRTGDTDNSTEKRTFTYVDVQERLGYRFSLCCGRIEWVPFSGLGFRHVGQKATCPTGCAVQFDYNEFYVPVGFTSNYCLKSSLSVGLNATWMPQFYPTVRIIPLNGARWILEEVHDNFLVELPITWHTKIFKCWNWTFIFKPFYEQWRDGKTTAKRSDGTPLGLPGIKYHYWGIDVNMLYVF